MMKKYVKGGSALKTVGVTRPIHDAAGKASGYTKYAADVMLPNMAHVCLVHSTVPHGYVRAVRTEKALAVPGVLGVFHCFNTTQRKYNRYRSRFSQELPLEERAFADYVRFVGDRVAAVAAVSREIAERAARLVEVEYEELPYSVGFDDTLAGKNCLPGQSPIVKEFTAEFGTPPEGACVDAESFTQFPPIHHATMEPHACVADYDPYQDQLVIYSPNQSVHGIRVVLADYLEMPYHKVRVVKSTMGGSFGAKQEWFTEPVAALIAKQLGRPVKLVYSRAEAMTCAIVRGAVRASVHGKYAPDGTLRSLDIDLVLDAGAYVGNACDYIASIYGKLFRCYRMEHVRYRARIISSNTPVSGAFRGWSAPETALFTERNLDAAARKLGMDRVDLRLKNTLMPGDIDRKSNLPMEDIRIHEALLRGRELFSWDKLRTEDAAFNASNDRYRRGVGVACGGHGNTYYPRHDDFGEGRAFLNEDGTVQLALTIHDHGCGTVTAMKMIAAEVLDMPDGDIYLGEGDTAATPVDFGCFASRTTFVLGRTVHDTALALRDVILDRTAELFGLPRQELYVENAAVHSKSDPDVCVSYREAAQQTMLKQRRNITAAAQFANVTNPGVTGAHFAHVEVDTWTGFTCVLDYLAVHDIGQPINPGMCVAQIQGAAQMGCGSALREEMVVGKDGRCTSSLSKYHLFLAPDLPNIRVELLTDGRSQEGPFGAKSIGEVSFVPAAPAVCGAVNDALGSELGVLPFTPDRILTYLAKEKEGAL